MIFYAYTFRPCRRFPSASLRRLLSLKVLPAKAARNDGAASVLHASDMSWAPLQTIRFVMNPFQDAMGTLAFVTSILELELQKGMTAVWFFFPWKILASVYQRMLERSAFQIT